MLYKFASVYAPTAVSITVFELWFGARTPEAMATIEKILSGIPILSVGKDAAVVAANEQNNLRTKNRQVEIRDLFIASVAITNNLPLVTHNKKHFQHFSSLELAKLPASN